MMLGSSTVEKSIVGTKTIGSAPSVRTYAFKFPSIWSRIGRAQCAHSVSTVNVSGSPRRCPCTKGVAIASIAQAALIRSPVSNATRCGVSSVVTGYAQATAPSVSR
jgi:hypothetical protein